MNKQINFEDTIFILNARIRLIRDLMCLDTDADLFLRQTLGDLDFISSALDMLGDKLLANTKFLDREIEADNLMDVEWQFEQLINEFSNNNGPFSPVRFPETTKSTSKFREGSLKRRKLIEELYVPKKQAGIESMETVVSPAELTGLLGAV
jgi:hypothetical protein